MTTGIQCVLSYNELCEIVEQGVIDAPMKNVNGSSIDITLHHLVRFERQSVPMKIIDLAAKQNIETEEHDMALEGPYYLLPLEFLLASSIETFNLPDNISCEYKLKSSMARNGLEHLNAGWCDATWHNSRLTLELFNTTSSHIHMLTPGMPIGQMIFYKHTPVPTDRSYAVRGQYNHQAAVTPSKGIR